MTPGTAEWAAIGTTVRVVVLDAGTLRAARRLVVAELAALDIACSRFRPDSEVAALASSDRTWTPVSDLLANVLSCALDVAARTGGMVDPTMGNDLCLLGYDRDFADLEPFSGAGSTGLPFRVARRATWRDIEVDLQMRRVRVPAGVLIDLGAVAKAWCADRCAARIAGELDTGVLVSLGGDLATAGVGPASGWLVRVQDLPTSEGGPSCTAVLDDGFALATSSTMTRSWRRGAGTLHHILDPSTRLPATPVWRTVTVAARTCVEANAATTAAIVRGHDAPRWLDGLGVTARLVTAGGDVQTIGGWPREAAA